MVEQKINPLLLRESLQVYLTFYLWKKIKER